MGSLLSGRTTGRRTTNDALTLNLFALRRMGFLEDRRQRQLVVSLEMVYEARREPSLAEAQAEAAGSAAGSMV